MADETKRPEEAALSLLPYRLASAAAKSAALQGGSISEIRLREGSPLCITCDGRNIRCGASCTREDIDSVVRRLCSNSLYSHAATIREGYISYTDGIRAGVCGRAVTDGGVINAVIDISSVCLRIPRRVRGAADTAYEILRNTDFTSGLLVYSCPGVGKTTLLRELISRLAGGETARRVAVVDTRCELMAGIDEPLMADVLSAYPRSRGIEIAVRTLSAEYIVCDEIGNSADASAVLEAAGVGVNLIASAHAGSFEELIRREHIKELIEKGVFGVCIGLMERDRESGGYVTEITYPMEISGETEEAQVTL